MEEEEAGGGGEGGLGAGGDRGQVYTTHNRANPAGTHFLHHTSLQQS